MDAYTNYIMRVSDARIRELRREAAEYAMSGAARRRRRSLWARVRDRLLRERRPVPQPEPVTMPVPLSEPDAVRPLRRSA